MDSRTGPTVGPGESPDLCCTLEFIAGAGCGPWGCASQSKVTLPVVWCWGPWLGATVDCGCDRGPAEGEPTPGTPTLPLGGPRGPDTTSLPFSFFRLSSSSASRSSNKLEGSFSLSSSPSSPSANSRSALKSPPMPRRSSSSMLVRSLGARSSKSSP